MGMSFIEVSALNSVNVDEAFRVIIKAIYMK